MEMNSTTFHELFALSRDAVLSIEDGAVLCANGAAEELFGGSVTGMRIRDLLPGLVLPDVRESFYAETDIASEAYSITGRQAHGTLLLTILRRESVGAVPRTVLSSMRSRLFTMKNALDALSEEDRDRFPPERSTAYHEYYALKHSIEQLELIEQLEKKELAVRNEEMDLSVVVDELIGSVNCFVGEKHAPVHAAVPNGECLFRGDRDRIEQLLLILLSNSLRHAGENARIEVTLQDRGDGYYTLSVEDHGRGFPEDALRYAFVRRAENAVHIPQENGAGLGLIIAQGLARLFDGNILLISRKEKGARICVRLPKPQGIVLAADRTLAEASGPELLLTELADVLDSDTYQPMFMD